MVYILSLLGVLSEVSLPISANVYIFTFSFLTFLVKLKGRFCKIIMCIVVIINSLQTDGIMKKIIIFLLIYYILSYFFLHFEYRKDTILLITTLQMVAYILLSLSSLKLNYIIFNVVGLLIMNYFYLGVFKRKEVMKRYGV